MSLTYLRTHAVVDDKDKDDDDNDNLTLIKVLAIEVSRMKNQ
jgi:hypothetical protein